MIVGYLNVKRFNIDRDIMQMVYLSEYVNNIFSLDFYNPHRIKNKHRQGLCHIFALSDPFRWKQKLSLNEA